MKKLFALILLGTSSAAMYGCVIADDRHDWHHDWDRGGWHHEHWHDEHWR